MDFFKIQKMVHSNVESRGIWDYDPSYPEVLCMIHSEVAKAYEAYKKRDDDMENFLEELVDVVIIIMSFFETEKINLEKEILNKL